MTLRKSKNILVNILIVLLSTAVIITIIAIILNNIDYTKHEQSEENNVITITRKIQLIGDPIYEVEYIKNNSKIVKTIEISSNKIIIDDTATNPKIVTYTQKIGPFKYNHRYLCIKQSDYIEIKHQYQKTYE